MSVRSMRGQMIDMARLAAENADKRALGNASMNARGDVLGRHGVVMKTQEQVTREYHTKNPKAVKQMALRDITHEVFGTPQEAVTSAREQIDSAKPKSKRKIID